MPIEHAQGCNFRGIPRYTNRRLLT